MVNLKKENLDISKERRRNQQRRRRNQQRRSILKIKKRGVIGRGKGNNLFKSQ